MYTKKGFTLIELLVVILIIGIFSGVVIVRNDEGNDVANDMKRKSDLEIIKDAAAAYRHMNFNKCPVLDCFIGEGSCSSDLLSYFSPFIKSIPEPDEDSTYHFYSTGETCVISVDLSNCHPYEYRFIEDNYYCLNE